MPESLCSESSKATRAKWNGVVCGNEPAEAHEPDDVSDACKKIFFLSFQRFTTDEIEKPKRWKHDVASDLPTNVTLKRASDSEMVGESKVLYANNDAAVYWYGITVWGNKTFYDSFDD